MLTALSDNRTMEISPCLSPTPNDYICIPETPKKSCDREPLEEDTLPLLPEFQILLRVPSNSSQSPPSDAGVARNLNRLFEKERPVLYSIHNKNVPKSSKSPSANHTSRMKRQSKVKRGIGHAIKRPKNSCTSSPLSDSLKVILAKKKAFAISTTTDESIVQIQSEVSSILKDLDNDATGVDQKDTFSEQLEKIDSLLTAVGTTSPPACPSKNAMGDQEMEVLIDNILGVPKASSLQTNVDLGSRLDEFEQIINRMEVAEEADDLFDDETSEIQSSNSLKLFPVFIKGATENNQRIDSQSISSSKNSVIFPIGDKEQMILDAGQKKYGQVECPDCQCVYDPDDRSDVEHHLQYHNRHKTTLKYLGWKNERVVTAYPDNAKVIQVMKGDPSLWWKRVQDVLAVVDFDLGFVKDDSAQPKMDKMVFLYIHNKQILGCLVAEDIDKANRMLDLPDALCSEEFFPALCGISRIWTAQSARRKGVASRLVDSMRENFLSFKTLAVEEIAFSSPSVSGREFAAKYTGNPCFLVFQ